MGSTLKCHGKKKEKQKNAQYNIIISKFINICNMFIN